ncbi:recombinase family protein [Fictibacillus sp. KIGAM418]|uniref:Recombinase family protein n=1 Tax=Fictibacillus marinisediminis TaxID=2878389 RepID=A0A9X1X9M9_9BACL|nr:recombinase family protein [Fictibacillus marinisediminis]
MLYGFAKCSVDDPNGEQQVKSLIEYGVQKGNLYLQQSETEVTTPRVFYKLFPQVKKGDTVVVHRFSSISQDTTFFINLISSFQSKGIHFTSLSESVDTAASEGQVIFRLFQGLAQLTQDGVTEKIKSSVSLAKVRTGGRPKVDPVMLELALNMYFDEDNPCSIHEIVQKTGVSRATFYRYLNRK